MIVCIRSVCTWLCICVVSYFIFAGRSSSPVYACVHAYVHMYVCAFIVFSHSLKAQRDLSTAKLEYSKMHQQMMQVSECTH